MRHAEMTPAEVTAIARAVGVDVKQEHAAPISDMLSAIRRGVLSQVAALDQDAYISVCFDAHVHGAA